MDVARRAASPRWAAVVPTVVALAVLAFVAALWAARIPMTPEHWLWNADLPKIDYPLAVFANEALANGRLPLWNDHLGLGYPLYAEGQIAAFYPPSWLVFRLPPITALDVYRVIHLTFAGLGAALLVLRLRGSRPGAVIALLVAILGGAIVAKLEWHNLVASYAWIPWVLLPLLRRPRPTRTGLVAAGTMYGIQALAGHPNTWLLTGIVVLAILVAGHDGWFAGVRRALGVGLLGAAIGAIQLVPTALLTTISVRSTALTANDLFASAATPFDILAFAFQGAFTGIQNGSWNIFKNWYPDGTFALFEVAAYVGLPVLGLAVGAARFRRSRPLLLAIALLVAIPVLEAFRPEFLMHVPLLNGLRSPVRSYVPAALLVGVLAGMAVGHRPASGIRLRPVAIGAGIPVAAYFVTLGAALYAPDAFNAVVLAVTSFGNEQTVAANLPNALAALQAPWPLALELAAGAGIVLLAAGADRSARVRSVAAPLAVVLVAVPLVLLGPAPNGGGSLASFTSKDSEFVGAVAAANPHRMLTMTQPGWYSGMPDQPAAAGLPDLRMFSSLNLRAVDKVTEAATADDAAGTALRRALGVDVVVTFDKPCPGTTLAVLERERNANVCRDDAAARPPYWIPLAAAEPDPSAGGLIRPREAALDADAVLAGAVPMDVARRDTSGLTATVTAPADGWAWIDRAWWFGWVNSVDDEPVETLQAMGGQLVRMPAGTHRLTQAFVPWDALAGALIALLALAVAIAWARRGGKEAAASGAAASEAAAGDEAGAGDEAAASDEAAPGGASVSGDAAPTGPTTGDAGDDGVGEADDDDAGDSRGDADDEGGLPLMLEAVAVVLLSLAAFTWRILPDVGFWDTAVFQGAAPTLGLTHPTGYPTFMLLGWTWTHLLPMLTPAFAMNLLTALAGAIGVGLTYVLGRRIGAGPPIAAALAFTLAVMLSYWRTASRADPHPLHVAFALAIVLLLLAWARRSDGRYLVAAALVFGLSMGNHLLTALLAPGIGVYVLTARPSILRQPRLVLAAVGALAVGLLVYLYVPIRAMADPAIHHDFAPTTWPLFLRYVLGQDFSSQMAFLSPAGPGVALRALPEFATSLVDGVTAPIAIALVLLAAIGTGSLLRRGAWRTTWLLLATGGLTLYGRLTYVNGDLDRYALYPIAVAAALAAVGAQRVWDHLVEPSVRGLLATRPGGLERLGTVPAVLLVVPLLLSSINAERVSIASARCYVDDVANRVAPDAVIVSWWSMSTPLWYAQAVEGMRPDVTIINASSLAADEVARVWPEDRPIYLVQLGRDAQRVRDAGYTLQDESFCGNGAWLVTGGPATATP